MPEKFYSAAYARGVRPLQKDMNTKKLPVPIELRSGRVKREFLIPFMWGENSSGFMGIETAKRYPHGTLVYVGVPVSAEEVIDRLLEKNRLLRDRSECVPIIEQFLGELQKYKIGNVLSISYSKAGEFSIKKEMETPPVAALKWP